MEKDETIMQR